MESPLTRRQLVWSGLGHHSLGAAITLSAGAACSREDTSSPFLPSEDATIFSSGMATSCSLSVDAFLLPLPAATISTSDFVIALSRICSSGITRMKSSLRRPALAQKYQHSGSPARLPSAMYECDGGSCLPRSQRDTAMAEL